MEFESHPIQLPRRVWRAYLLVLALLVGPLVALQVAGGRMDSIEQSTAGADPTGSLLKGDIYIKEALAGLPGTELKRTARAAIKEYNDALPWPVAYRRIGVIKEAILHESGMAELGKIDATDGLEEQLRAEADMWRRITASGRIEKSQVGRIISILEKSNLGPLSGVAEDYVYRKAGDPARAAEAFAGARRSAFASLAGAGVLVLLMFAGGLAGIVLAVSFLSAHGPSLSVAPRPPIQPPVLMLTFFAYMVGFVFFSLVAEGAVSLIGLEGIGAGYLALQGGASIAACALGLRVLRRLTSFTREDPRDVGLRMLPAGPAVKWGIGGLCGALPFWGVASLVSAVLSKTIFKSFQTPEHPFLPIIARGGTAEVVALLLLGGVIAPIVEETFFRGALYGALRGSLGVWAAAALSAGVFAVIHPIPGSFLPIMALAIVLALLREKTGSLAPSIICHSLYNTLLLGIVLVLF